MIKHLIELFFFGHVDRIGAQSCLVVGHIPTKVKYEDLSLEDMGFILDCFDYLYMGPMMEF